MKNREWTHSQEDCFYYYDRDDGKVCAQVHKIVHTKIWVSKIIYNHNQENYIGQFISENFAKKAIERHWEMEDNTLTNKNDCLPIT